jgi:hypothetical protein
MQELIYVKNCSEKIPKVSQARSEWCNFSHQFHVFTAQGVYFPAIFRVCVKKSIFLVKSLLIYDSRSILKCSHGTFVTFIHENGVPKGKLQLWMKLAPALVPLEAWFWCMLFFPIMCIQPDFIRFHHLWLCVEFVLLILSEIRDMVLQIIGLRTTYTKTKPLGVPMQELISFKVVIFLLVPHFHE